MTPTAQPTEIDPNNAFTRDLLRNLVGTVRAQPDETGAEYSNPIILTYFLLQANNPVFYQKGHWHMTPTEQPTEIDPNNPFTHDLLRNLVATVRAQADETDAEYAERFAAVTTAWAAFHPRRCARRASAPACRGGGRRPRRR